MRPLSVLVPDSVRPLIILLCTITGCGRSACVDGEANGAAPVDVALTLMEGGDGDASVNAPIDGSASLSAADPASGGRSSLLAMLAGEGVLLRWFVCALCVPFIALC